MTARLSIFVFLLTVLSLAGRLPAAAQLPDHAVHIQNGGTMGGGYTIANGEQCFVVTARHVAAEPGLQVEEGELPELVPNLTVFNTSGLQRTARLVRMSVNFDLALYKVEQPAGFNCASNWNNGASARQAAQSADRLYVLKADEQGNAQRIYLVFGTNDGDTLFQMYPQFPNQPEKRPRSGDSGSPVFAGSDQLVGIIQDIDSATGDVTVISQKAIDSEFQSEVVSAQATRLLVSQVSRNGNGDVRTATLSLLDVLDGKENIIAAERNKFYAGTQSWRGNIAPNLVGRTGLPDIPFADYLLQVDIVNLQSKSVQVPKYPELQGGASGQDLASTVLGSILTGDAKRAMEKSKREREQKAAQKKNVIDASADLEFRLTNTVSGEVVRHREQNTIRVDTTDWGAAQEAALTQALSQGTDSVLTKAGL